MGLFNYNKPGKGVNKGVYETPVKVFFSVFFRKFFKMIRLNFMYFVSTIPLWLLLYIPTLSIPFEENSVSRVNSQIIVFMLITVVGLPIFNTGFAFILRNFSRQHHSWLWSDFCDTFKTNSKQSAVLTLIDIAVFFVAIINFNFYATTDILNPNLEFLFQLILGISFFIYFIMHYFIYTIMVTFELPLRDIFKNALILTFLKFPRNLLITALIYVIGFLIFGVGGQFGLILNVLFLSIFINYIVTFNATRLVDKYLMPIDYGEEEETLEY